MSDIYERKLFLAPMAGFTDSVFRKICTSHGADVTVSEMICAKALCYEQKSGPSVRSRTAPLAYIPSGTDNCILQIFGHEPEFMAEAARMLMSGEYKGYDGYTLPIALDINMGCPVKKITSNGDGSALMKGPRLAREVVRAVKNAVSVPVSVKMRIGWDRNTINAVEFARYVEDGGADAIFVHGRTKDMMYSGHSDNTRIASVKEAVSVPVIGNGDVNTPPDAVRMYNETGCDGIMIGRGALGNPWIFENIKALSEGKPEKVPSPEEIRDAMLVHFDMALELKGDRCGIAETKSHLAWYIRNSRGAASVRDKIMRSENAGQIREAIYEAFNTEQDA